MNPENYADVKVAKKIGDSEEATVEFKFNKDPKMNFKCIVGTENDVKEENGGKSGRRSKPFFGDIDKK